MVVVSLALVYGGLAFNVFLSLPKKGTQKTDMHGDQIKHAPLLDLPPPPPPHPTPNEIYSVVGSFRFKWNTSTIQNLHKQFQSVILTDSESDGALKCVKGGA